MDNINNEVLVSVICLTFNHENYISKCIESLVTQKTNFKYEVWIHDDCSTDETRKIIEHYKKIYPTMINLILQDENQYSKGTSIVDQIILPRVHGKYVAFCEGDDYWTDEMKLQKQIDAMKENPQCWISAHSVNIVDEKDTKVIGKINPAKGNTIFDVETVIRGDGGFVGTNSILINKKAFELGYSFRRIYSLDYFLQILGALNGGMLYLSDCMSAYRWCAKGSWTSRMSQDINKYCEHYNCVIMALKKLDDETQNKYHRTIYKQIQYQKYGIIKARKQYAELLKKKNWDVLKALSMRDKIKALMRIALPWLDNVIMLWRKNNVQ